MAQLEQIAFCTRVKNQYPEFFKLKKVLDVGSLDINGNNKYLFDYCEVTGIDVGDGPNVDVVSLAHEFYPLESYDVIISTECFEHDLHYPKSLNHLVSLLRTGGMFLFTCATTGRPEHGTKRTSPEDAPLLEWSDYYKNLTEQDIRDVLRVDTYFKEYQFDVNNKSNDLYFFGIKR